MKASFTLSCKTNKDQQDMSRHILDSFLSVLFSNLQIMFIYGIHLILPAQGTNSKNEISALTISTIQFSMVS